LATEDIIMLKTVSLFVTIILLFAFHAVHSDELADGSQNVQKYPSSDLRQLVSMPEQTRQLMREEMLDHLSALSEIIGYLAENNFDAAANIAESRIGKSSIGKHRGSGMGPGRFMPLEMRKIGWGMHESVTDFSRIAKEGNLKSAYSALHKVTAACAACHYRYRTQ